MARFGLLIIVEVPQEFRSRTLTKSGNVENEMDGNSFKSNE